MRPQGITASTIMREPAVTKLPPPEQPPSPLVEEFGRIDAGINVVFDKLERLEYLLAPILTPETPQAQGGQNARLSETQLHQRVIDVTNRIERMNEKLGGIISRIQL